MEEIQLKYIEIYCAVCYYFHGLRHRIRDTTNVTNNRFTETYDATGPPLHYKKYFARYKNINKANLERLKDINFHASKSKVYSLICGSFNQPPVIGQILG